MERPLPSFPFPIEACRGQDAVQRLARLREQGKREGFTPVILGDAEDLGRFAELPEFNQCAAEEYVRLAGEIDVIRWFNAKQQSLRDGDEEWAGPPRGDWPAKADRNDVVVAATQMRGGYKPQVFIARFPSTNSWETFAHLRYGNWNECPEADVHVAIAQSWNQRFGAEVVAITSDTVELEIARPPRNRDEAVAAAWEQYWYCNDIVDQGMETINRLAASLLVSKYWFFWWD